MNSLIKIDSSDLEELKQVILKISKPKYLAILAASLSIGYVTYRTVVTYRIRRKFRHIPGEPTKGLIGFYLGHLPQMVKVLKSGKIMDDIFVEWHEKYGEVFKVQLLDNIFVITSNKTATRDALIVKNYPKIALTNKMTGFPFGERFMGLGLVTDVDNERWRYRRAIFNPGFHRHVLITFVGHFNQVINQLAEKFRSKADGKTVVSFFNEINRATLDAIALIAFGMHTDSISAQDSELNISLAKILHSMQEMFFNPFMQINPLRMGEIRTFRSLVRKIRKIGKDRILERINAFKNNEHMPDDILSSILNAYKGDEDLDIEAMTDDFITFFVAGQETTANTLSFCFLEMGKNPEIVRKAREEIDRVLGERTEVTYQDVNDLKYCSAIFKEALRLYPPAVNVSRCSTETMEINSYKIPENTFLLFSTFMNARIEKFFKEPLKFMPERFLKIGDSDPNLENYVYFPFSLGPRNCIGQNFAQLEGVIAIAKLLQMFDFRLDPNQSFAYEQALTLRPKDNTRCFLTLRAN